MTTVDYLKEHILADALTDFRNKGLGSEALQEGYVGVSIPELMNAYCGDSGPASRVDFDLALKDLETKELISTGPWAPYDNDPTSGIIVIGGYSKREYIYLTEKGYRAAAQPSSPASKSANRTSVHISGGTFHHSPIGIGDQVTQSINLNVENPPEVVEYLLQLLSRSGTTVDDAARQQATAMVEATRQGNLATARPLFQRLFGAATGAVKEIAWGVLSAIITKQLGLS